VENPDDLFVGANLLARLLIGFAHLMAALHALYDIDIIFPPQGEGIFCLALRTGRASDKTFTHWVSICRGGAFFRSARSPEAGRHKKKVAPTSQVMPEARQPE
jgi:hypothetical protein